MSSVLQITRTLIKNKKEKVHNKNKQELLDNKRGTIKKKINIWGKELLFCLLLLEFQLFWF